MSKEIGNSWIAGKNRSLGMSDSMLQYWQIIIRIIRINIGGNLFINTEFWYQNTKQWVNRCQNLLLITCQDRHKTRRFHRGDITGIMSIKSFWSYLCIVF